MANSKLLWDFFQGNGQSEPLTEVTIGNLKAPPWRQFMSDDDFNVAEHSASTNRWKEIKKLAEKDIRGQERGSNFQLQEGNSKCVDVLNAVNSAIYLRRPLLITGSPGSGKTSLAYAIAHELQLGVVLTWAVNARSQLKEALYQYDAVARLQDAQLKQVRNIGNYIRLGAVGTAFLPSALPRVLLIDEIDKCDINLPNDLLELFEEGRYEIPELVRCKDDDDQKEVLVRTADKDISATIREGQILCREFPIIIMTSNGERDVPPAFLRRCIRVRMPDPREIGTLTDIVEAHLKKENSDNPEHWENMQGEIKEIINSFLSKSKKNKDVATDQLLNVIYLLTRDNRADDTQKQDLQRILLKSLTEED